MTRNSFHSSHEPAPLFDRGFEEWRARRAPPPNIIEAFDACLKVERTDLRTLFETNHPELAAYSASLADMHPDAADGGTFERKHDQARLGAQQQAVQSLMADGAWRTLREIAERLGIPEASASARIRDLRKARCGSRTVERRRRGDAKRGVHEYRLL